MRRPSPPWSRWHARRCPRARAPRPDRGRHRGDCAIRPPVGRAHSAIGEAVLMYPNASMTRLKAARRLTKRAFRQRERAFLAEGPQAVSEALAMGAPVTDLFVTAPAQARHAALIAVAADAGISVQVISGEAMSDLAQTVTPQGLLAVCGFIDVPLS